MRNTAYLSYMILLAVFICSHFTASSQNLWSDPDTWTPQTIPADGDDVTIPEGMDIILDVNTADLGILNIEGSLSFDDANLELTADRNQYNVNGSFEYWLHCCSIHA